MAVGKGSMARASKAATKTTAVKEAAEAVETKAAETVKAEGAESVKTAKAPAKKAAPKKTTKKPTSKTVAKETAKVASQAVVTGTSEEVMKTIVYQKSTQVLDREPEMNETFGVGEAMPIYFF